MQLVSNLFRVDSKQKNADIIYYIPRSLVSLQQGNVKRSAKSMKIVSIEGANPHIF